LNTWGGGNERTQGPCAGKKRFGPVKKRWFFAGKGRRRNCRRPHVAGAPGKKEFLVFFWFVVEPVETGEKKQFFFFFLFFFYLGGVPDGSRAGFCLGTRGGYWDGGGAGPNTPLNRGRGGKRVFCVCPPFLLGGGGCVRGGENRRENLVGGCKVGKSPWRGKGSGRVLGGKRITPGKMWFRLSKGDDGKKNQNFGVQI